MQKLTQLLLAPFALLFGVGVSLRHWLYDQGFLKGVRFDLPVISVGNLSVGGTGKTPHIEYLIAILNPYLNLAVLSRGYRRSTKGFRYVQFQDTATEVGDEPLQFKQKFTDVVVGVSENRTHGIQQILMDFPATQTFLLDDAYQHWAIQPSLNILLTAYDQPFTSDFLLPMGRLREWRNGYERANVIIVTKCPPTMSAIERDDFEASIRPLPHQQIFFSHYRYLLPYYLFSPSYRYPLSDNTDVLFVCAIADTLYLEKYLEETVQRAEILRFPDHHYFSKLELSNLKTRFDQMKSREKIILTTEKDATRLRLHQSFLLEHHLPIFVLPVQVDFLFDDRPRFDAAIRQFLLNFKS